VSEKWKVIPRAGWQRKLSNGERYDL